MKKTLYRIWSCALLALSTLCVHAADGIIETKHYNLCEGDTLTLTIKGHKTRVFADTILYDTIRVASSSQDSIYQYVINVNPAFRYVEHREIVLGQSFTWCGETIHEAGTYTKIYKTAQGCDSTYVLVVTEKEGLQLEFHTQQVIPFCDSVAWNDSMYTTSAVVVDTLKSLVYGCDSIVTTILQQGIPFRHYETDTILLGETLYWHGLTITEAGEYTDAHTNRFGCDSTYVLRAVLKAMEVQPKVQTTRMSICDGDSFEWRNKEHTLSGTYYDTAFIGTEIDTLYVLVLTVNPTYEFNETVAFTSFPALYRGENIPSPGTYPITYTSSTGCDSIINVIVNRQAIVHEETVTICNGEEYVWRFQHLKEPQTYIETIKGKDGADSVTYILHLNVHTIPETHITRTICKGDSYVFGTRILTEAGIYRHTFKQDGCDSVVELSLNIADVDTIVQVHHINQGETYTWPVNGRTYGTPGVYQQTEINRFGCDSILRLVLTVNHVDTIDTVATICPGETIVWHTISANQTGHFENAETDPRGDLKYYRLDLTVLELAEEEVTFSICGDESVTFNGKTYDKAGHYYDKGTCDTLYHIIVSQTPTQVFTTNASLYSTPSGEINPYHWTYMHDGVQEEDDFDEPGTYEFTSPNDVTGCNDIWRLILRLDESSYHFVEQVTLCEGEPFSWRGHDNLSLVPGEAVYTETLQTRTGQDSIYELQVTVKPVSRSYKTTNFCGTIEWKGTTYDRTTIVYDTLTAANGCDSIVEMSLRKIEPFFRRDTATIVQGEQLIWHNQTITTSGVYEDRRQNQYGCDSVYELHVGIKPATPQTNMITTLAEICEGDYFEWRGKKYYNTGNYPDTVFATSAEERDTIYVLNLNVIQVDHRREQHFLCENETLERLYGKDYNALLRTDTVYRDTIEVPNPEHMGCPDIVYLEIYKYPVKRHIETQILHPGDTIIWNEQEITRGGDYSNVINDTGAGNCDSINILHVVEDLREQMFVCMIDTPDLYPYVWREDTFYTSGLWFDTVFDASSKITEFHSLDLTITQPFDTAVYLHDCKSTGVVWRDELFLVDTAFIDRVPVDPFTPEAPCDTVYHVNIRMDTVYHVTIDTTLCEEELPLIIGRQDPDTIWAEGTWPHADKTACNCDSTIIVNLKIIPSLTQNDSTFRCEEDIKDNPVVLGNLTNPWFDTKEGGKYHGKWEGNWHGISYTEDTIVYNCDSTYFHHVIVRPHQTYPKDTTYYLCYGDSVQLFWPKQTWVKTDGIFLDTVSTNSPWEDNYHSGVTYTHSDGNYWCDSVTRWTVKYVYPEQKDTTAHRLLGDSIWWGGAWRYYTGSYDSIGDATQKDSNDEYCRLTYTLHLIVDTAYYFRDTVDICTTTGKTHMYIWPETGYKQSYTVGDKDTIARHYVDSLITHDRRDSIYDLCVNYRLQHDTLILDTLCEGESRQFDIHRFGAENITISRFITEAGRYWDTITAQNGCDSVIELRVTMRPHIAPAHKTVMITDREIPYLWHHSWIENGLPVDSTDTLRATGEYRFVMPSIYGCDSIDSLSLTVHQTHVFRDTIDVCAQANTTQKYQWETGYVQTFQVPDEDQDIHYFDTLQTRIKFDSIYDLLVHYHLTTIEYRDANLCYGDSMLFGLSKHHLPRYISKTGVYNDTLTRVTNGCDSIIVMRLNVFPRYFTADTKNISIADTPYVWHHIQGSDTIARDTLRATGGYTFHFTNSYGCDSIDSLSLTIHQTYLYRDTVTICQDQTPYSWEGIKDIYRTGEYVKYLQTHDGYDSTHVRFVRVLPVPHDTIRHAMCEGAEYLFNGRLLTEGGTYEDTLASHMGCDSIVTLLLKVNKPYYHNIPIDIYEGDSYTFYGETYTTSGTYRHSSLTPEGCDSVTELCLTVHPLIDTVVTICKAALPYHWINKWSGKDTPLYAAGTYRDDTTYVNGKRTFYTLQLIVNEASDTTLFRTICEGDEYNFNGRRLTQPGEYRDTIGNAIGCDSVIILHLNVLSIYHNIVSRTIYEGDSVFFEGQYYYTAGSYPVHYTSSFHCDSVIELQLTVNKLYDDSVTTCYNALPYIWHGKEIYQSGLYRDTIVGAEGRVSVTGILVTVLPVLRAPEPIIAAICEGDFYKFGKQTLTEGGTYYDTITSKYGCDSIVSLVLSVYSTDYQSEHKTIYEGDSVFFDGQWLKEAGVYEHRELNGNGCTSVYHLVLTVLREFKVDTTATICTNDLPFVWRGIEYSESGDYAVPTSWNDSSRVVTTLHLTVNETFYSERNISLCAGDTFLYKEKLYFDKGIFYDTVPSLAGCDSIIKYIVSVHPTYDKIFERHISDKDTVNFHDRIGIKKEGTYEWTGKTIHGCDSMEHLILIVHPSFFKSDTVDICQSDSVNYPFVWKDENGRIIKIISKSGVYNDSILTSYGFDSVHQVVVNIHPSYFINEQYEISEGEILRIHNRNISAPGIYQDTLHSIYGCDSIFHTVVNPRGTREFFRTAEICQGEVYDFFGKPLTHAGKYTYTSQYKDSIVYLTLTVNPISITEKRVVITDKQLPYIYNGRIYEQGGIYTDTLINRLGCDSLSRFVLVVSAHYSEWYPMPLCPGSEIKIDGQVITEAGLYTFLRRSKVTGEMDSIYRVEVYDAPAYDLPTEKKTICEGDSVLFADKWIKRGGHHDFYLKTQSGCDSILHLDLTVNPSYHFDTTAIITDYESISWRGNTYNQSGTYSRSWPTINDCDSTYTLHLYTIQTQRDTLTVTICDGQSYTWRGHSYERDGYYVDTVRHLESNFSAIYSLRLIVAYPTHITSARTSEVCADAESFDIEFEYEGLKPTHYSVYFDALAKREGFADVINATFGSDLVAHVPLPQFQSVVYQNHPYYVRPDYYTMRIALDNGVCGISRSDSLTLLVRYPNWIIEQNWNDVVAPLKSEYNGGYEFAQTEWYVNDVLQNNTNIGYLHSDDLHIGDKVVMKATRKGENYAIPTCPLEITQAAPNVYDNPIIVYPTQAPKQTPIVIIQAPEEGNYFIFSSTGMFISSGKFEQGETQVTLPSVCGIYLIRTTQGKDVETHKVLLY